MPSRYLLEPKPIWRCERILMLASAGLGQVQLLGITSQLCRGLPSVTAYPSGIPRTEQAPFSDSLWRPGASLPASSRQANAALRNRVTRASGGRSSRLPRGTHRARSGLNREEGGRGLFLVAALSTRWDWYLIQEPPARSSGASWARRGPSTPK
jgi:hypothetical protein